MLHLKHFSHVIVAMIITTQVFAGAFDVATIESSSNATGDLGAIITQADKDYVTAAGGPVYTQNVALISQTSDADFALIDQKSGTGIGTGNFSAITQSGVAPSVAYIFQSGSGKGGNMAVINQR